MVEAGGRARPGDAARGHRARSRRQRLLCVSNEHATTRSLSLLRRAGPLLAFADARADIYNDFLGFAILDLFETELDKWASLFKKDPSGDATFAQLEAVTFFAIREASYTGRSAAVCVAG